MIEALKPCPFCGHKTPEFERLGTPRQSCIVVCGNCGCRHESSDEGDRCGQSWNERAIDATLERQEQAVAFADRIAFEGAMKSGKGCDVWPTAGDYEARTGRSLIALYAAPTA